MSKRSGVYQIVNEVNGKSYVGSSVDIANRWRQWRHHHSKNYLNYKSLLLAAFQKYGIENFTFIVLEECPATKDALEKLEQHYLDLLKPEYNLLAQAYTMAGYKFSEEHKQKLRENYSEDRKQATSERSTAYMNDPVNKQRYSELREGKTWDELFGEERSQQIRDQLSASRKLSPVVCAGWNKGVPMTDEQKELLFAGREAWIENGGEPWNKGEPMFDELRKKLEESGFWEMTDAKRQSLSMSHLGLPAWNKGQTMGDAYCQAMSDAAKARHDANPELQTHLTEAARLANTGKSRPQEVRERISASNLVSEARKAFAESRRGIARPEIGQKVSETLQTSEKAKEYHQGRIGKSRGNNPSGQYGVIWDKGRNKWQVRIQGKLYGRFERLEDAVAKAQEVLAILQGKKEQSN